MRVCERERKKERKREPHFIFIYIQNKYNLYT